MKGEIGLHELELFTGVECRVGGLNNYTGVLTQQICITTSADIADIAVLLDFGNKSLSIQTGIAIPEHLLYMISLGLGQ